MKLELFLPFYSFFFLLFENFIHPVFIKSIPFAVSDSSLFPPSIFSLNFMVFLWTYWVHLLLPIHAWVEGYLVELEYFSRAPCPRGWLTFLSPSASISYQLLPRSSPIRASILAVLILCTSCACSQSCYESLCNGAGMSSIYCFSCSHQLHLALTVFWPNLNNVSWPLQGKTVI